jgi:hypothetical protein
MAFVILYGQFFDVWQMPDVTEETDHVLRTTGNPTAGTIEGGDEVANEPRYLTTMGQSSIPSIPPPPASTPSTVRQAARSTL